MCPHLTPKLIILIEEKSTDFREEKRGYPVFQWVKLTSKITG